MQNNLIQAITAYTTTLEQKLSALEARVAELERANEAMKQESDEAKAIVATLQAEVAALATANVVAQTSEPEVEIELIMEDDTADEGIVAQEETEMIESGVSTLVEESSVIPTEEELVEEETSEPIVLEIVLEEQPSTVDKLEDNSDIKEVVVESKVESARVVPTQTTLFASVEDIRQAISLGDRFLFQRELFAGNGELMQKTLDELNNLTTLTEAMQYVSDHFDWDKDSTAVQLFENVLRRRFQ